MIRSIGHAAMHNVTQVGLRDHARSRRLLHCWASIFGV